MAASRISYKTTLSPSIYERRQVQARIRALQQRTNALYEELSHSSSNAKITGFDIERAYSSITNEFREQRDQLLRRLHHVKKDIKESVYELDGIRRSLHTAKSFHLPKISPRYSTDIEAHEMNSTVDDIERVLNKIGHQLKEFNFIPPNPRAMNKRLGTISIKNMTHEETTLSSFGSFIDDYYTITNVSVYKLYTVDLDISAKWVIASIDKRLFLCDIEGEVRIFSYARHLRRQPLLTERFHLSNIRLVSSFTVTTDYLVAFEVDTQILTLHTHHGALLMRLYFPYDISIMTRCDYHRKNQIWTCSPTKRQCHQLSLNHKTKKLAIIDILDFTNPVSNILIDPIGISCDDRNRIAVHDVNTTTTDRLLLYMENKIRVLPLDFVKYHNKLLSSRIERVLLVPKHPNLIVLVYAPRSPTKNFHEVLVVDISAQPVKILHYFPEANGIQNIDVTQHGELVYTVTMPANKRLPPKMHVYNLINY